MRKNDRYLHLKYIRDQLFGKNLSYYTQKSIRYALQIDYNSAHRFIVGLKTLPCIGEDGECLKPVSHFYTDEKQIFQTFPEHFQTLPKDLLQGEVESWMRFFKNIGLKESVNADTFTALCSYVANGKLKEKTETGSRVLLDYLFSFEEAKHHGFHQNLTLLRRISQIEFVCPVPVPELEWIHKVHPTQNKVTLANGKEFPLCKLFGSCLSQHKLLIWAIKSVVQLPNSQNEVCKSLGVCLKPTATDLMESIGLIAKTCFADQNLFIKYTAPQCIPNQAKLMDVMVKIFLELQNFQGNITGLKSLRCIPVYAISKDNTGQYPVLVEPRCVVFRQTDDTKPYYPYLHGVSSTPLYQVKLFLERLGVKDSLQLEHMQLVLQSAFNVSDSGTLDMEPNTMNVVSCAVIELSELLEKNKTGRQQMGEAVLVEKLKPLYLSGTDKRMHPVESLVYTRSKLHHVNLEGTNLYLLWTPRNRHIISPERFCELLPRALRPKALSELCTSKVSDCKESENVPKCIQELKRSLKFHNLQQALCLAGSYYINKFINVA